MHLNLYGWLHLVRGSAEMRDEVGTAMRPWRILNMVVSLWFFRRCSRVGHCWFSSITDTLLCCWSPTTNSAALLFTLPTLLIFFWRWDPSPCRLHCYRLLQGRPHHCEICNLLRLFWAVLWVSLQNVQGVARLLRDVNVGTPTEIITDGDD